MNFFNIIFCQIFEFVEIVEFAEFAEKVKINRTDLLVDFAEHFSEWRERIFDAEQTGLVGLTKFILLVTFYCSGGSYMSEH